MYILSTYLCKRIRYSLCCHGPVTVSCPNFRLQVCSSRIRNGPYTYLLQPVKKSLCSIDPDSSVGNTLIVCAENSSAVLSILVGSLGTRLFAHAMREESGTETTLWVLLVAQVFEYCTERESSVLLQVRLFVSITHSRTVVYFDYAFCA